jgi:hypothetical protein
VRDTSVDNLPCRKVVDQAPDRPRKTRIAIIPAGIAHGAGSHAAPRHLGENLLPEGPERLDRRTRLRFAKLRVKLRFLVGVAKIGFHRALAEITRPARQHVVEINRMAHERGERPL